MTPPQVTGLVSFTVYNPATGEILRHGHCSRRDLDNQARVGQAVLEGAKGHDIDERVIVPANGAKPYLRRRALADIAKRSARPAEVSPVAALLEALKAKGIDLSQADLEAGALAVQARRKVDA